MDGWQNDTISPTDSFLKERIVRSATPPPPESEPSISRDTTIPVLTVILPTKNEENSIAACIAQIQNILWTAHQAGEILVSDSSMDYTPEIARSLGAQVVSPNKLGYGYAYRYAIPLAKSDLIVIGDADSTYNFSIIPDLLAPLRNGTADIVLGSRFLGSIQPGAMPLLHRYLGNPLLTWVFNTANGSTLTDTHTGLRAFTREAYQKIAPELRTDGMEFATEMLEVALRKDLRIAEIPITYSPRKGESNLNSFSDGWRHLRYILLRAPTLLFLIPGLVLLILGLFFVVLIWAPFDVWDISQFGTHSIVAASLATILGFQVTVLGLFAQINRTRKGFPAINGLTTKRFLNHLTLERGATFGLFLVLGGTSYILYLISQWIISGYRYLPVLDQDIAALTFIGLGLQIFFNSFFLSVIGEEG
ncbi:MAG: glycosyltransferase family 2 protein [Methanomicrobiales archaeon]|nr:glycosyltransferase family 2 protein [Methanomicrobiales archaeon]